jgi:ABC-type lipoprotein release transport system permease subunit
VISDGITGHLQVRSDKSNEGDMVVQQKTGWDDLVFIPPASFAAAETALQRDFPEAVRTRLVRQSAFLHGPAKREETILMGIEPEASRYRNAFLLAEGRYLNPAHGHEIMLTREQAKTLSLRVGDTVRVKTKNRWGRNTEAAFTLVGTGDFILLSMFSYKAAYTTIGAAQTLIGLEGNMVTDLIAWLPDKGRSEAAARKLSVALNRTGTPAVLTRDEHLKTADLRSDALPGRDEYLKNTKLKISDGGEMGEVFRLTGEIIFIFLNTLLVFLLLITSFLIINLVYLTGLERYREIGTLRAIGFSRARVTFVFMAEVAVITAAAVLAAVFAAGLVAVLTGPAGVAAPSAELAYLMGRSVVLQLRPGETLLVVGLCFLFSGAAAFIPALRAASLDPARTIRTM